MVTANECRLLAMLLASMPMCMRGMPLHGAEPWVGMPLHGAEPWVGHLNDDPDRCGPARRIGRFA